MASTDKGGLYRVRLGLDAPSAMHPAWLVGAAGARYPSAEVVSVQPLSSELADVVLRWRGQPGEVAEGHQLVPLTEGMQLIPGADMPSATVKGVDTLREPMHASMRGVEPIDIAKLLGAAALIGFVAWASYRIEGSGERG